MDKIVIPGSVYNLLPAGAGALVYVQAEIVVSPVVQMLKEELVKANNC